MFPISCTINILSMIKKISVEDSPTWCYTSLICISMLFKDHKLLRIDGTINNPLDREKIVQQFQTDYSFTVMLMTTQVCVELILNRLLGLKVIFMFTLSVVLIIVVNLVSFCSLNNAHVYLTMQFKSEIPSYLKGLSKMYIIRFNFINLLLFRLEVLVLH